MSWGLTIKDIYVIRVRKNDLEWLLEEVKEEIEMLNLTLAALAAVGPHEVLDVEGSPFNWEDYVSMRVKEVSESLKGAYVNEWIYETALEDMDNVTDE